MGTFRRVFRQPALARLLIGWGCWSAADWLVLVVLATYAFERGGPSAVAALGAAATGAAALLTPMLAHVADRRSRPAVLTATATAGVAAGLGMAALLAVDGSLVILGVAAATWAVMVASYRPTSTALLPTVVRGPDDLVAYNAVWMTVDSAGSLAGPLIAALVVGVLAPGPTFLLAAVAGVVATVAFAGLRSSAAVRQVERAGLLLRFTAGFRAILGHPTARLLVGLGLAQTTVGGSLQLLLVVISVERMGAGERGVGVLYAAIGLGGLAGSALTVRLVGTRRLALVGAAGLALWGAPFAMAAVLEVPAAVVSAIGVIGIGNVLVDISVLTLLQRCVPDEVLARVMGAFETLIQATRAIGALIVAALVAGVGSTAALLVVGSFLPVCAAVALPSLARVDRRTADRNAELALLRAVPMFRSLPVVTAELLASHLRPQPVQAGAVVVRQGDPGDSYYLLESGAAEVLVDGRVVGRLGPGDGFGELALLQTDRRTATVRCLEDSRLRALDREVFLLVVTGDATASAAARRVAQTYQHAEPHRRPVDNDMLEVEGQQ